MLNQIKEYKKETYFSSRKICHGAGEESLNKIYSNKNLDMPDKDFTKRVLDYVQNHVKRNLEHFIKYDDDETTSSCRDADELLIDQKHLSIDSYESSSNSDFDDGSMETDFTSESDDCSNSNLQQIFVQNHDNYRKNSLTSLENIVIIKSNLHKKHIPKSDTSIIKRFRDIFDGPKEKSNIDFTQRSKTKHNRNLFNKTCIICNQILKQD